MGRVYRVPMTSFKGALTRAFTGSGAFQFVVTMLALQNQFVPPTLNWTEPDANCVLDYVGQVGRSASVNRALINSFGFGGEKIVVGVSRADLPVSDDRCRSYGHEEQLVRSFVESAGCA